MFYKWFIIAVFCYGLKEKKRRCCGRGIFFFESCFVSAIEFFKTRFSSAAFQTAWRPRIDVEGMEVAVVQG